MVWGKYQLEPLVEVLNIFNSSHLLFSNIWSTKNLLSWLNYGTLLNLDKILIRFVLIFAVSVNTWSESMLGMLLELWRKPIYFIDQNFDWRFSYNSWHCLITLCIFSSVGGGFICEVSNTGPKIPICCEEPFSLNFSLKIKPKLQGGH